MQIALEIGIQLLGALAPILASGLGALGVKVAALIGAKTNSQNLQQALLLINDSTVTVVQDLAQTVVAAAKAKGGGQLNAADAAAIKQQALDKLKAQFTQAKLDELAKVLGLQDITKTLESKIEAAVLALGKGIVQSPGDPTTDSINTLQPFYQSDAQHPAQAITGVPVLPPGAPR